MWIIIDHHNLKDFDAPWRLKMIPAIGPYATIEAAIDSAISRWGNRYDDRCQTVVHENPHNDLPITAKITAEDPDEREITILPIVTPRN